MKLWGSLVNFCVMMPEDTLEDLLSHTQHMDGLEANVREALGAMTPNRTCIKQTATCCPTYCMC